MVVEAGGDGAHDGEAGEAGRGPTLVAVLFYDTPKATNRLIRHCPFDRVINEQE
jgi:hypothetical protein